MNAVVALSLCFFCFFRTHHHENVVGLHITVRNSLVVTKVHGLKDESTNLARLAFGVHLLLGNPLEQTSTFHFLHDHIDLIGFLEDIEQLHDGWATAQDPECCDFVIESLHRGSKVPAGGAAHFRNVDDLGGTDGSGGPPHRPINDGESSTSKLYGGDMEKTEHRQHRVGVVRSVGFDASP